MSNPKLALLGLIALSVPGSAQIATALLREGDALPGLPGHTVTGLDNTAVDQNGGWSVMLGSSNGVDTLDHVWGSVAGAPAALLRTESTIGTLQQVSFESFFGMSAAGEIAYSPSCTDLSSGTTGIDGVWVDGNPVALEAAPIPTLPGTVWRFASRPGMTANSLPYWVGGINDATTGANLGNGLFIGTFVAPVLRTGDAIPGLPAVVGSNAADFDSRFSLFGRHWISVTDTDAASTADNYPLIDGAAVIAGGATIGEGQAIPAGSGGLPGESWDNFDFLGINEVGEYLITGDTDASSSVDEFISKNGTILWREGDVVDGHTLTGSIEGAYMNEAGQIAYVWDVVEGGNLEALYLDDRLLLLEGDEVDWDGDGYADAGTTITDFTGISMLTVDLDPALYFVADVAVPGVGTREGVFRIRYNGMAADVHALSVASGGTQSLSLDASPGLAGTTYWVLGTVSGTSPGTVLVGALLPLNLDAYTLLTINAPNQGILVNTAGTLDASGRATAGISLPAGTDPNLAGLRANHAFVSIDLATVGLSFVSNDVSLTLRP